MIGSRNFAEIFRGYTENFNRKTFEVGSFTLLERVDGKDSFVIV